MTFVLRSGPLFYSGRAAPGSDAVNGVGWVTPDRAEAFSFATRGEATRRCRSFNKWSPLHGRSFQVADA